jgi:hypothetical protein
MRDMPQEFLMANQVQPPELTIKYNESAIPVEELGAWHPVSIPSSIFLDVPSTRKLWRETGVDLKRNLESKKAILDSVQLYAAHCRAIKKKTVGTMS